MSRRSQPRDERGRFTKQEELDLAALLSLAEFVLKAFDRGGTVPPQTQRATPEEEDHLASLHRTVVEAPQPPRLPEPPVFDVVAARDELLSLAVSGASGPSKVAALASAEALLPAALGYLAQQRLDGWRRSVREARREWNLLLAGDPATVAHSVQGAFHRHLPTATCLDVRGDTIHVAVAVVDPDELEPGVVRRLARVASRGPMLDGRAVDHVASSVLAAARWAAVWAPSVDKVAVVALTRRREPVPGRSSTSALYSGVLDAGRARALDSAADAREEVLDRARDPQLVVRRGRLQALRESAVPEVAGLVALYQDIQHGEPPR